MTDEELMQALCAGDRSAYRTIVERHLKAISSYAFRVLGNRKDTEDIAQETFLKLWLDADRWDPGKAGLSTWLHRIAHNLCVDHWRKQGRVRLQESLDEAEREAEYGADDDSRRQFSRERMRHLHRALAALPEQQRSALMLCHYSGFSNKEAAAIMNLSVKALESAIGRARRNLRTALNRMQPP